MGMYTDVLAAAKTFTNEAGQLRTYQQLEQYSDLQKDPAAPAAFAAGNEVQTIAFDVNIDGGTFTLTFTLADGVTFTTAAIAYTANAATIQTAIDTASPASVANGAIVVTGGNIATADIILTFSGTGTAGTNPGLTTIGNSLTDSAVPVADPEIEVTTAGATAKGCIAILSALGAIAETTPNEVGTDYTAGPNLHNVKPWFVKALAKEQGFQSGEPQIEADILAIFA